MYISGIERHGRRRMRRCGGGSRRLIDGTLGHPLSQTRDHELEDDFVSSAEAYTDLMITQAVIAS